MMKQYDAMPPRRSGLGLSLLEVGMALALAAVVMSGITFYTVNAAQKMKRRSDAQHLMAIARAGDAYIIKNTGVLLGSGGDLDPGRVRLGTVITKTVKNLQDDGELSQSIQNTFSNGQSVALLLRAVNNPAYIGPTSGVPQYLIKGLVTTHGGTSFSDDQAGQIVNLSGAAGGYMSRTIDRNNIDGAGGGWKERAADWHAGGATPDVGHVMALVGMGYGAGSSNNGPWLGRKSGLDQQFYKLDTGVDIDVNGNALKNASAVQANEYQGAQGAGSDINIGTLTTTPNISMGSAATQQFHLYANNTELKLGEAGSNSFSVNNTFGESFTLTHGVSGAGSSTWSAEEPRIVGRQDNAGGDWVTVFDSKPNGELDINAPVANGVKGVVNVTANGNGGEINFYANNEGDGSVNVYPGGKDGFSVFGVYPSDAKIQLRPDGNTTFYSKGATTFANRGGNSGMYINTLQTTSATAPNGGDNYYVCMGGHYGSGGHDGCVSDQVSGGPFAATSYFTMYGNFRVWGDMRLNGNGIAYDSSDRRLKTNIEPLAGALNEIERLNGYSFKWKKDGKPSIGVIAQEVEKVFPSIVEVSDVSGMKAVKYGSLVAPLIEAVKTLHHMLNDAVASLKQDIAKLRQDDASLQAQVQNLTGQNVELKADLARQRLDLIKLKYAIHQPLNDSERALCGAACP
ncbi:tail fiber domain-containing protein [Trinickia fusca]|uniref:Peptidase S74 domain-containing protein n=1 Tax=Trinickia fusca TaxID=2419777 RepID=A0A494XU25_9BURK|nr:tail fiber domain-containing protein [Trinickia fusca]RKP51043.1 hypothetical protein D7S89_08315 [Trinickia fusca]